MMFLRHPAWLWLKKHDKDKLPSVDENLQAIFDTGHEFEQYAEKRFPGGVTLGFENYDEYKSLPKRTQKAIDDGEKIIFQGRFEADGATCIIDVIERVEGNTFDLIEIKSSTGARTDHELDLAFQAIVLEGSGLKIRNISVVHVNNQYVREGDIDYKKLTARTDITEKVRKRIPKTKEHIKDAMRVMNSPKIPDISPRHARLGSFKDWLEVYEVLEGPFAENSVHRLASPGSRRIGELEDLGIEKIDDIPYDFKLTPKQQLQVSTTKTGKRIINEAEIKGFLDKAEFPLYFLDYETLGGLIPAFDGLRPYQQLPFQYSLHILDTPDGKLRHKEYLHQENTNPAKPLVEKLKQDIGDKGTIFVWYESFEKGCNELLGELVPEEAEFMNNVNARIMDLMTPFAEGWFVDKNFQGSASIKKVLPVLVPELSYKDLDIQEGMAAQRQWMKTVLTNENKNGKDQIFSDLLEYCKLDTLAMVKIYKELINLRSINNERGNMSTLQKNFQS